MDIQDLQDREIGIGNIQLILCIMYIHVKGEVFFGFKFSCYMPPVCAKNLALCE